MTRTVVKYPGAKWRIAEWIISHMPQHHSYLEPYFGSGAVFFRKNPSKIETINDLDSDVVNLFKIIREDPTELMRVVKYTPFAREEYESAYKFTSSGSMVEKARIFLLKCWQGHGSRTNAYKSGWKNDIQGREAAYAMRYWYLLPQWIENIVDRLREAQIEHRPAIEVIKRFNYPKVLIYADPPYLLSTRSGKQYKHEMTEQEHIDLLELLLQHKGSVLLSGYDSDLYNDYLQGWSSHEISTTAEKGKARTEKLWIKKAV